MEKDFKFKKKFGQNFIFDKNFLNSLLEDFNLSSNSVVVEIGAGMGTLSECLANKYSKVLSFEIDNTLKEHLHDIEKKYKNIEFIFNDILKEDVGDIEKQLGNQDYFLIANLPYYITSAIIFKFLFESKYLKSMFVMVQKEVGERFCAKSKTKDYGIPTVLINTFASCKIIRNVKRKMFVPEPKVDSCILEINLNKNKYKIKDIDKYRAFVSNSFRMKRKTLYNNLFSCGIKKDEIVKDLEKLKIKADSRPEMLEVSQFVDLFNLTEK